LAGGKVKLHIPSLCLRVLVAERLPKIKEEAMSNQLPTHSQVVIIGGGIVGCSVAYHLTKLGWKDIVLLERKQLTSGTTWAAAGLIGQLRASREMTNLAKYGTELYARLEEETGQATGYKTTGALGVAQTEDRNREWLRGAAMARAFGIEMFQISSKEAQDLVPLLNTDDLVSVFYLPKDGQTNPVDTAQALAKGARMGGTKIIEGVKVLDVHVKNGAVCGVSTDKGDIACEYVVNCGGMWGREIGKMVGVSIPLHAAEHMHMVTKPIEGLKKWMPTVRDFDGYVYFREEGGGLLMGGFEPVAKPWGMKGIPEDFMFTELQEDWDQFEIFMKSGLKRFPCLETAEVRHLSVVPESFTPDNAYMLGEAPGIKNFFVACGMNSVGIASAGGAGKALAQWIDQGYPEEDLWSVDIRRFFGWQQNSRYLHDRTVETVGLLYAHHYPYLQRTTARPVLCSPFHDRLAEHGACWQNWFEFSAQEHMAVREGVGVYDLTSMHKYLFQGRDAEAVLQYICANDMGTPIGKIVYTQLLNERGGIEADLTVTRLAEDSYFIVTSVATGVRDFDWINRHTSDGAHAILTDVTHGYAMLAVMGPKSRELLQMLTDADLSNGGFPFGMAQQIDMAYTRPWALRISYVGEMGWELYIPTAFATGVFDTLMAEGTKFGLRLVGLHAVDSLRLEKGYRHWGSDITPDDTPFEAGLGFGVKFDKGDFIGRDALLQQKKSGLTRKLVIFTLEAVP
jgi:4-methylaminobutanoate oxidase (formaldehyde-forming)